MNEKSSTIDVKSKVLIPILPNYLRLSNGKTIGVEELTIENLETLGREWTQALIALARKRKAMFK